MDKWHKDAEIGILDNRCILAGSGLNVGNGKHADEF
jgi:hypothetical protein